MAQSLTTKEGQRALYEKYKKDLFQECLPFWQKCGPDTKNGGFFTAVDRDGTVVDDDKSVWFQGRAGWMFATAADESNAAHGADEAQRRAWLDISKNTVAFMDKYCFDKEDTAFDGLRMWFMVTADGKPLRKRRYCYSESFGAIAHAALAKELKANPMEYNYHAKLAHDLFELYTRWSFTPGVAPAKFTNTRPMVGMGPRMICIVTAQELRACLGEGQDKYYTNWIDRCIADVVKYFAKPDLRAVMEQVTPEGEISDHFDGRMLNPGHAIEGSWFIMHEGKLRNRKDYIDLGLNMLDWMWERGWDKEHGGLLYFRDVYNKPVQEYWQDMKFWWAHDEAMIATLYAYLLTGNAKYAQWHKMVHDWSYAHFHDNELGEWYGYLHRDGTPSSTLKGTMWKGPFHYPRMLQISIQLLSELMKKQ
eukprot:TRINITY_DN861_c0_g1_i1.p2 TRINITY_DN861_c0_g1~~TRINITY_DN861_c0_g1_i1.p2  ORF type:complete len:430 (-),score=137.72 TRINITY_DN861_c0_g1_i1:27-1286(-)